MSETSMIDVLSQARELLLERGWHQGGMFGPAGRVCLLGACHLASDRRQNQSHAPIFTYARYELEKTLAKMVGCDTEVGWRVSVGGWNDDKSRTFNEVLDLLDNTLLRLKEQTRD